MTQLVGILNLTPDSFSDGGKYVSPAAQRASAEAMIAGGAAVIDVGAESTRPGATALSANEEWARLAPFMENVLPALKGRAAISIDTRHPETARCALAHGADWINDVSGFADAAMVDAVKQSEAKLVVMHSLSVPADPALTLPLECDPVAEVLRFARARLTALAEAGIAAQRLIFDPGLGFGKTAEQSLALVQRIGEFRALEVPLLVGHSRKSFLKLMGANRDAATLSLSLKLMGAGVEYLRVHDISAHRELAA